MRTIGYLSSDLDRESMLIYATVTIALWTSLVVAALSVHA